MKPATQRFPQRQPMRRVLASISNTMEIGVNPTLVCTARKVSGCREGFGQV